MIVAHVDFWVLIKRSPKTKSWVQTRILTSISLVLMRSSTLFIARIGNFTYLLEIFGWKFRLFKPRFPRKSNNTRPLRQSIRLPLMLLFHLFLWIAYLNAESPHNRPDPNFKLLINTRHSFIMDIHKLVLNSLVDLCCDYFAICFGIVIITAL